MAQKVKKKRAERAGRKSFPGLGIMARLMLSFTAVVAVMLVILWIFQILLLDFFYERTKMREFTEANRTISGYLTSDRLEDTCYNVAIQYDVCIRVFACSGGSLRKELASVDASQSCIIHHIPNGTLQTYYSNSLSEGGTWVTRITIGSSEDESDPPETREEERLLRTPKVMAIDVRSVTGADGTEYAVFMNAEFTPMYTVTQTLGRLFWWIAAALLIIAFALAYFFSLQISRPLEKMNESAKSLAAGNYDIEFSSAGCRETRELGETLNYAADEISKSDHLQKELIANISHDLRTPLTMIAGYSEIMRDIPSERSAENVQVIIDESNRLTSLVNDMLDLSRIRAGTKLPDRLEFNLTETVREVMQRYAVLVAHDGYKISFEAASDACVCADRTMMLQVVYNLINNAVNYCGEDKTVLVSQSVSGGRVRVTVTDHGEGIPPEEIGNIWDRYYKVDRVHRRARIGTGLGLSIVRNILQLHGASFGVESTRGCGSSFWFELPVASTGGEAEVLPPASIQ